ncbi:MAG: hypothetical protein AB8U25_07630 [Rickettsiales endosymbiont of Dermacentor nuttalli]
MSKTEELAKTLCSNIQYVTDSLHTLENKEIIADNSGYKLYSLDTRGTEEKNKIDFFY